MFSSSQEEHCAPTKEPLKYGEIVVLGYNGSLPNGDRGRRKSRFSLYRRVRANGLKPSTVHVLNTVQDGKQTVSVKGLHSISYTLSRNQTVVVEYSPDKETDMFQIGRSTESPIDFVVTDTVSGGHAGEESPITQSTISRFACRIVCERNFPYRARIYAAGFDSSKNIFLGEKAAKWKNPDGHMDGLTTNGVLVMHPRGGFTEESRPGVWREISVCGDVYTLRETRSAQTRGKLVDSESNVLQDGSLIDLCGATLLWRTADGLLHTPTQKHIEALRQEINAARPQCPVGLNTLVFPSMQRSRDLAALEEKQPWVYLACGHVHGFHNWGHRSDRESNAQRECPMCRTVGPYVPLWLGCEPAFYVDTGAPTYAFVPCGHVCSEKTAKYWSEIQLPHGTHAFHASCPFCASQLSPAQGYARLIFQGPID
ncbi:E3 ubiquitin-protein ligase pellino homolog 2 isoform X1 [Polypterus senegalus]|uniref:E3 ubiquitin-protein ligase pellino homolog 2 isoform X1 n=1 Tax=Polypterus senegalus TaxID=55291 RepID=UPI001966A1ED|nr:E3 ubiquitin-protein ligase pellino homolog 2 isoform X1 [Polypterus senegalus]